MGILPKNLFLLGVGGMGMAPLAILLQEQGYTITAFDDSSGSLAFSCLEAANISFSKEIPEACEMVVHTSAANEKHPLIQEARKRGIECLRRGEVLAKAIQGHRLIAVVGSHGKTTTTGMLIWILKKIGFDFSYYLGGVFQNEKISPAYYSKTSPWFVAEIDESDGTIDLFNPAITLALNLSWDHAGYYTTEEKLLKTFSSLFQRTQQTLFIPSESEVLNGLVSGLQPKGSVIQYAVSEKRKCLVEYPIVDLKADYQVEVKTQMLNELEGSFISEKSHAFINSTLIELKKGFLIKKEVQANTHGFFNVMNATAALSLADFLSQSDLHKSLEDFPGIKRRQDVLLATQSLSIITDYAHHPRELAAFLEYTRLHYTHSKRLIIFQPHRYSRTLQYAEEFSKILSREADVHLLPVYAASEAPLLGGTSEAIAEHIEKLGKVAKVWIDREAFIEFLNYSLERPSLFLFIGAGHIDKIARDFAQKVKVGS